MNNDEAEKEADEDEFRFKDTVMEPAEAPVPLPDVQPVEESKQEPEAEEEEEGYKPDPFLDKEIDPNECQYCNRKFRTPNGVENHFKKTHEKKVLKLEKKLKSKANGLYKPSKKQKWTLQQFKA